MNTKKRSLLAKIESLLRQLAENGEPHLFIVTSSAEDKDKLTLKGAGELRVLARAMAYNLHDHINRMGFKVAITSVDVIHLESNGKVIKFCERS